MLTPGLSREELSGVLHSGEYSKLVARGALYTERSGFESGFKVARDGAQLTYHKRYDRSVAVSMGNPTEGIIFPGVPQTVASFHTHPETGFDPKHPRDFLNCHISEGDALHMQTNQRSCQTFIAGVVAKDVYNGPNKLVVGLHRAKKTLSSDEQILTGYWRAASDREGLRVGLSIFLGILVARIGFDIVAHPDSKEPTIQLNDKWDEMHTAMDRLYPD